MKSNFLLIIFFLCALSVPAQNKEAQKIDEFGYLDCDNLSMHAFNAFQESKKIENSKIYIIYYEGKHLDFDLFTWNEKLRKYDEKFLNPRRGDALRRASDIIDYLKNYPDFSKDSIVFADGGYREKFSLEVWIVPKGASLPKPTPTLEEKDITFRKGKPFKARNCIKIYDGL